MNLLKTPHEKLLEEAGMTPASPGMLNTPRQLLLQETGTTPNFLAGGGQPHSDYPLFGQNAGWRFGQNADSRFGTNAAPDYPQYVMAPEKHASGGQVAMSPQDMLASLVASGHLPAHYATGGGVLGTEYKPEYNPEATMQATPFLSSVAPVTNAAKARFADIFGQTAADRIFGGPQGQDAIYQAAQFANPVTGALGVADIPFNLYTDLKKDDYLGAGLTTAGGVLSAIPAYKPAKALVKAGHEKIKKLLNP